MDPFWPEADMESVPIAEEPEAVPLGTCPAVPFELNMALIIPTVTSPPQGAGGTGAQEAKPYWPTMPTSMGPLPDIRAVEGVKTGVRDLLSAE